MLYAGSFGTLRGSLAGTMGNGALSSYVTAATEETDLGVENPTPARRPIHDHKTQERVFAYFSYAIDSSSRITAMLSASTARFQIPNTPNLSPAFAVAGAAPIASADLDERQREENEYAIVSYQKNRRGGTP